MSQAYRSLCQTAVFVRRRSSPGRSLRPAWPAAVCARPHRLRTPTGRCPAAVPVHPQPGANPPSSPARPTSPYAHGASPDRSLRTAAPSPHGPRPAVRGPRPRGGAPRPRPAGRTCADAARARTPSGTVRTSAPHTPRTAHRAPQAHRAPASHRARAHAPPAGTGSTHPETLTPHTPSLPQGLTPRPPSPRPHPCAPGHTHPAHPSGMCARPVNPGRGGTPTDTPGRCGPGP